MINVKRSEAKQNKLLIFNLSLTFRMKYKKSIDLNKKILKSPLYHTEFDFNYMITQTFLDNNITLTGIVNYY